MLLRHAKSAHPSGGSDIDRPLAPGGRERRPRIGAYLRDGGLVPGLALVSSARRTRETWDLVRPALGDVATRLDPRIYEAPADRLLAVVREVEPDVRALLMIGHNPGFAELAGWLVGDGDRHAFARLSRKYPTSGLAVIEFSVDAWARVDGRGGRLARFVTPKTLGADEDD